MPTVSEVESLRAEVEGLKEKAARSQGALEQLKKELNCQTVAAAKKRLKELESQRAELDAEFQTKLREYSELCDAHRDPAA